jgi:hypothetical protein
MSSLGYFPRGKWAGWTCAALFGMLSLTVISVLEEAHHGPVFAPIYALALAIFRYSSRLKGRK